MRWFRSRDRQQPSTGRTGSTSAGASGRRFFFLGGRRYLADADYMLPKDEGEINRLDFQHYMLRQALRTNFLAPVRSPASILDVGCGTGRWPVEMARAFPDARVVGLDLELPAVVAVSDELRPRTCTFVTGDVLQGLPFPDASFDFVHQRLLMGAILAPRWPDVVRELARVARPGGWIELVEAAPASGGAPALVALNGWMFQATARRGVDVYICQQLSALLQSAGLAGVTERRFDLPMGRQGGHLGMMAETQYLSLFGSLRGMIVGQGMVDAATYDGAMRNAREELAHTACVSPYVVAYAQRPR